MPPSERPSPKRAVLRSTSIARDVIETPAEAAPTNSKLPGGVVLAGAVIAGIGTLMPWAVVETPFGTLSRAGVQGDGLFILILAAIAGILGAVMLTRRPSGGLRTAVVVALGIGLVIVSYDWAHITTTDIQVGPGVYLTVIGSLIGGVGAMLPGTKPVAAAG